MVVPIRNFFAHCYFSITCFHTDFSTQSALAILISAEAAADSELEAAIDT